ncbi:hypothetical protein [Streptomyces sp. NBC_00470]|uniref:hypothetical protein n=1 Tax=Streptomyces sp. NBC_00470 TaxID=2975753 RepID=UPI002F90DFED
MASTSVTEEELQEMGLVLSDVDDVKAVANSLAHLGNLAMHAPSPYVAVVPVAGRWLHFSCGLDFTLHDTEAEADAAMAEDIANTIETCADPGSQDDHDVHASLGDTNDSVTVCRVASEDSGSDQDEVLTVWRHNGTPGWESHTSYESALESALYEAGRIADRVGGVTAAPLVQAVEIALFEAKMGASTIVPDGYGRDMEITDGEETHFLLQVGGRWTHANDGYLNRISWQDNRADAAGNLLNAIAIENLIPADGYNWVSPDEQDRVTVIEQDDGYALVWVLGDTAGLDAFDGGLDDETLAEANARAARILRDHQEREEESRAGELTAVEQVNAGAMRLQVLQDELKATQTAVGDSIRQADNEGRIGRYKSSGINWTSLANSLDVDRNTVYEIRKGKAWPKEQPPNA